MLGAKTKTGGILKYFLLYDMLAALYCVASFSSIILENDFLPGGVHGPKSWKFWTRLHTVARQGGKPLPQQPAGPHPRRCGGSRHPGQRARASASLRWA